MLAKTQCCKGVCTQPEKEVAYPPSREASNGYLAHTTASTQTGWILVRAHIDLETRCDLDLLLVGLANYVAHDSFEILLTAIALNDGEILQWEGIPDFNSPSFNRVTEWHAFNAPFERACLAKEGFRPPVGMWRDTMAHAYARGFSGGLASVGEQIGIPRDTQKLSDGTRLINKFCKPKTRVTTGDKYWEPETARKDWAQFCLYNRQDVNAERAIYQRLSQHPMTEDELALMRWDWGINDKGMPVDLEFVWQAQNLIEQYQEEYLAEMKKITGLRNPNSRNQLLGWVQKHGVSVTDLKAETIQGVLG